MCSTGNMLLGGIWVISKNRKYIFDNFDNLDTSNAGSNDTTGRIKQNVTDALFTARVFLPGLFEKNVFLILNIVLPLVDFLTDAINAGNGLHTKNKYYARLNRLAPPTLKENGTITYI